MVDLLQGFRVRIGARAGSADTGRRRLAVRGSLVEICDHTARPWWEGVAVALGGGYGQARADGVRVLLAGEVYNGPQVAEALGDRSLAQAPDAELVLAAWLHWGLSSLRVLNGRFALALSDERSGAVVLGTDHAGSVPLWVRADQDGLDVSTEAKVLNGDPTTALEVNGTEPVPGSGGVHRVPAGTAVLFRGLGEGRLHSAPVRTWTPPLSRELLAPDQAVAAVRARLTEAVRARVRRDPLPTVVLSGGIDSSGVAALSRSVSGRIRSVSMGTDLSDEFPQAALVARHLDSEHSEIIIPVAELLPELVWAVWAAETADFTILEYLMPLVALYRRLADGPRRILTGYGADIPLGGMHRTTTSLGPLDAAVARDMATFDGLNEMTPVLSGMHGMWSTHPYWDRDLLDLLVRLDPGLKHRHGRDKWVLRQALSDLLPAQTVNRPKLGVHESSGTTSAWTTLLTATGVPVARVADAKRSMARQLFQRLVIQGEHPAEIPFDEVLRHATRATRQAERQATA